MAYITVTTQDKVKSLRRKKPFELTTRKGWKSSKVKQFLTLSFFHETFFPSEHYIILAQLLLFGLGVATSFDSPSKIDKLFLMNLFPLCSEKLKESLRSN